MAVVTISIRNRSSIAVLRVRPSEAGDVIVLQTMMWPDEVRVPDFSIEVDEVKDSEVAMAKMLVDTLAGDFDADEFTDDYADAVETMVRTKLEGGEVTRTETPAKSSGEVVDLLAALQRSVQNAKKSRGESDDTSDEESTTAEEKDEAAPAAKTTTTKKTVAKMTPAKQAAKKATAKKTTAKKTPAKKAAKKAS